MELPGGLLVRMGTISRLRSAGSCGRAGTGPVASSPAGREGDDATAAPGCMREPTDRSNPPTPERPAPAPPKLPDRTGSSSELNRFMCCREFPPIAAICFTSCGAGLGARAALGCSAGPHGPAAACTGTGAGGAPAAATAEAWGAYCWPAGAWLLTLGAQQQPPSTPCEVLHCQLLAWPRCLVLPQGHQAHPVMLTQLLTRCACASALRQRHQHPAHWSHLMALQ
ncbi:hypothetical protein HaLaN_07797 [Haematococcus lacustris]|uniref:Uncharacterized protein n=1 Tax=Haematococcus lacustris TaxID=44745 RepID=A0A699YRE3_HAELA|nr:hypothetical protein HaLaN_07797 [Haematococcus lacustris]